MQAALATVAMETISDIRAALGVTQAEFASRLGLDQSTISRMESGEIVPDKRTMIAARTLLPSNKASAA